MCAGQGCRVGGVPCPKVDTWPSDSCVQGLCLAQHNCVGVHAFVQGVRARCGVAQRTGS